MKPEARICFQNRTLLVADDSMKRTLDLALRAAVTSLPVLIVGESGTGKELVARFIHERSPRVKDSFVSVNCAAIPDGLMEAELFGFERGAFTGAIFQKIGKFERANQGTLLLDEISEMSVPLQAKLLRVLQESEVDRLGGKDSVPINTRVIATTNRDPLSLISDGSFREDLYYRLNVVRIECAPLRGRIEAIVALAEEFLTQSAERQGRGLMELSDAAMEKICEHSWPGNIRELQNAIERAVLMTDGDVIESHRFEGLLGHSKQIKRADDSTLSELEQEHILNVLEVSNGNRTHAAKKLGISVRTLRNKIKEYQVG
jgi:transcriptional regulator with PAS, ATPase and Fis domain